MDDGKNIGPNGGKKKTKNNTQWTIEGYKTPYEKKSGVKGENIAKIDIMISMYTKVRKVSKENISKIDR